VRWISELEVVREIVGQRFEAADLVQVGATSDHDGAECEIKGLHGSALQYLAPEIGVDRDGFPMHRDRGGICQTIEAIDQADARLLKRVNHVPEEIGRNEDIAIAYRNDPVLRLSSQLDQV
jgi:hypothetical protein